MKRLLSHLHVALFFIFFLIFFPNPSQAQETDSVPINVKIMGKGIQNKENFEISVLVCVGGTYEVAPTCDVLRLLKITNHRSEWVGNSFPSSTKLREDLRDLYSDAWSSGSYKLAQSGNSFTSQDGWNWSEFPTQLSAKDYRKALSTLRLYAEMGRESLFEDQEPHARLPIASTPANASIVLESVIRKMDLQGGEARCNSLFKETIRRAKKTYRHFGGNADDLRFQISKLSEEPVANKNHINIGSVVSCHLSISTLDPRFTLLEEQQGGQQNVTLNSLYRYDPTLIHAKKDTDSLSLWRWARRDYD